MFSHEDLAGNVWTNPFDQPDGIDNDANGYVDDVHGWDFDGRNNSFVYDGAWRGMITPRTLPGPSAPAAPMAKA